MEIDIRNAASLEEIPIDEADVVYHLAARQYHLEVPWTRRQRYFEEVNLDGTFNVLKRMSASTCRQMVFFSTDMVYGFPDRIPVGREHPRRPLGPYGESKRKAEDLCEAFRHQGMNITVLRPRLIVGPGRLGVLKTLWCGRVKAQIRMKLGNNLPDEHRLMKYEPLMKKDIVIKMDPFLVMFYMALKETSTKGVVYFSHMEPDKKYDCNVKPKMTPCDK